MPNMILFAIDDQPVAQNLGETPKMIEGVAEEVYKEITFPGFEEYNTREIIVEFKKDSLTESEKANIRNDMVYLFNLKRLVFKEKINDTSEIWSFSKYDTSLAVYKTMNELRKNPNFTYILYHSIMHMIDGHENPPLPEDGEILTPTPTPKPTPSPIKLPRMQLGVGKSKYTTQYGDKDIDPENKNVVPILLNGRVLLPIRAIVEELGGTVEWEAKTSNISIKLNDKSIKIGINNKNAVVNDKDVQLDVPPMIQNGRTLVPVRFIAENLGFKVDWAQDSLGVSIW